MCILKIITYYVDILLILSLVMSVTSFLEKIDDLNRLYKNSSPEKILSFSIDKFESKIVYVCSFGTESAIILSMISKINKNFPILLINTNFLFPETLEYKEKLLDNLGLHNCIEVTPEKESLKIYDPENNLWKTNVDKCCEIRKVIPLQKELEKFDSWISGRKSYHLDSRENLNPFEQANGKIIINPLVSMTKNQVEEYFNKNSLPKHPLFSEGYLSIGCINCTSKTTNFDNVRSGRWKNNSKTECGIHLQRKN